MATQPLTGSLSSPLVTAMADAPMRVMDGAAFDFFLIEMVNTLRTSSAHAQARARKVEQEMIDAGLLPAPLPTPAIRREHRESTTSLASKATSKVDDEEEGLRLRLEAIGMHVGANITERYVRPFYPRPSHTIACIYCRLCHGKPYFSETLESIKFVCKDLWTTCWDKQVDNLRTNHRVSFPYSRFSLYSHLGLGCVCIARQFIQTYRSIVVLGWPSGRDQASQSGMSSLESSMQRVHKTYRLVCYDARGNCERSSVEAGVDWCSNAGN